MPYYEDRFEVPDGLELYEQCWLPPADARAVVLLVHGFTEHGGRYAELAEQLNRHRYAVHALDLRGHGKSEGTRTLVRSFDEYLADLEVFCGRLRRRWPRKPLFLFGHSMGGTIVGLFAATRPVDAQGLVLSAPAVRIGKCVFPVLRRLASFIGWLFPRLRCVRLGTGWISRDPRVVEHFRGDPLVFHGRFPVRTGAEILRAAQQLQDSAQDVRLPLLILQGTGDRIVDPEGSRRLHLGAASKDKTLQLYEGLYHDLFHEPEKEQVTADLIEWLGRKAEG